MDTKKLRQRILDLAIHGKLVPQDPNDEPASVLLKRMGISPDVRSDESLPEGWCFLSGENLFRKMRSVKPSGASFKYIDIDSVDNENGVIHSPKVIDTINAPSRATRFTQKGDVLFSMVRPYLRNIARVEESDCIASTGFFVCSPIDVMTSDFCYYLMRSDYIVDGLNQYMKGDNSPSINNKNILDWNFPVPPLNEQKRIVAAVEQWMSLINVMECSKAELQQSIVSAKAKILDLAIHGRLVPQDPNDEPASELLKRVGISPDVKSDESLPEGWCCTILGLIGKWQAGGTPSKMHKEYYGGDIPWLKTGDLNDGYILEIPEFITEEGLKNSSARLIPTGSVLIAMYGATIGKLGILTFPATTNQACCACVDYKGVEQKYLFYFLKYNKATFIQEGGGGAQPNISKEIIVNTKIPLPPLPEQHRIVSKVEELFSQLDVIKSSLLA